MPQVEIRKLIGKSIFVTTTIPVYRVSDINEKGDKAKPVVNVNKGYSFVLDSYLTPTEAYKSSYGLSYAKRSDIYFLFYGHDKHYYAVKYKPDGRFSWTKLQEQGVTSTKEDIEAAKEAEKSPIDKITEAFSGAGKTVKTLLYIGVAVFAIGYLVPKFIKK